MLRLNKHNRANEFQRPEKSVFRKHLFTMDHRIDWNRITISKTEKECLQGLFAESWPINKSSQVMNNNHGETLFSVHCYFYFNFTALQFCVYKFFHGNATLRLLHHNRYLPCAKMCLVFQLLRFND